MNQARATQVLNDINNSMTRIESECERLCLLIVECRAEQYWKLRFPNERAWGLATFGTIGSFRHLAAIAEAYKNEPNLIGELGRAKAEAMIPVIRQEGTISPEWKEKAAKLNVDQIKDRVRSKYKTCHTPKTITGKLRYDIRRIQTQIAFHQRQIPLLEKKLGEKMLKLADLERAIMTPTPTFRKEVA